MMNKKPLALSLTAALTAYGIPVFAYDLTVNGLFSVADKQTNGTTGQVVATLTKKSITLCDDANTPKCSIGSSVTGSGYLISVDDKKFDVTLEPKNATVKNKLTLRRRSNEQAYSGVKIGDQETNIPDTIPTGNDNDLKVSLCRIVESTNANDETVKFAKTANGITYCSSKRKIAGNTNYEIGLGATGLPYQVTIVGKSVKKIDTHSSATPIKITSDNVDLNSLVVTDNTGKRDNRFRIETDVNPIKIIANQSVDKGKITLRGVASKDGISKTFISGPYDYTIKTTPGNNAPTTPTLTNKVDPITKNGKTVTVGTLNSTDKNGDRISYEVTSNTKYFTVEGSTLKATIPSTYNDNSIAVTVIAKDGKGGTSSNASFRFTLKEPSTVTEQCDLPVSTYTGINTSRTLQWELKDANSKLHKPDDKYTWFNPNIPAMGEPEGFRCVAFAKIGRCNTDYYVKAVNAENNGKGYCGHSDWRLPTKDELLSLKNQTDTREKLDFPNGDHWTSTVGILGAGLYASQVVIPSFNEQERNKTASVFVRLVRVSN